ncbi:hypothetical protein U1Q18_040303 [Sarracenia purpurea var. burkii]
MYPKVDGDGGFTGFGASGLYPVQGVRLWVDDDVGDTLPGGAFEAGLCSPKCTGSLYRQPVPLWPPKNYMGFHPVSFGQTNCGIRFAEWRDTFCFPAGSVLPPFLAGWLGLMGPTVLGDRLEF